jgi:hypothetical protein
MLHPAESRAGAAQRRYCVWVTRRGRSGIGRPNRAQAGTPILILFRPEPITFLCVLSTYTDYQTTSQRDNYPLRVSRPGSRKRTPVDPGGKRHFTGTERSQP